VLLFEIFSPIEKKRARTDGQPDTPHLPENTNNH